MINVLIADDQNFVRKTIESYLNPESDLNIVGFAENGEMAIDRVATLKPDVVLMDIEMPIMDGLTATKTIVEKFSETKVLILTIHDREQHLDRALKLGAKGYWLKNTTAKELANAIRYVHKGYFQLALELVEKHIDKAKNINFQLQEQLNFNNKLSMVDTVLAQLEEKIDILKELNPDNLNQTIETVVKEEMAFRRDRDANLQFKLDRLKNQLKQLRETMNLVVKLQLGFNIVLILTAITFSYLLMRPI